MQVLPDMIYSCVYISLSLNEYKFHGSTFSTLLLAHTKNIVWVIVGACWMNGWMKNIFVTKNKNRMWAKHLTWVLENKEWLQRK